MKSHLGACSYTFKLFVTYLLALVLTGCAGSRGTTTKLDKATGMKVKVPRFKGQVAGPGMVFVEGGTMVMGALHEDPLYSGDSNARTVSVGPYFIDPLLVTNFSYTEYLKDLKNVSEEAYDTALPNQEVWAAALAYNDSYVQNYLWHPGFWDYPVVGVSWTQANEYCKWRTKTINDSIAQKSGKNSDLEEEGDEPSIESGRYVVECRLPTEAEWEFAARGIVPAKGNNIVQTTQRVYPWDGLSLRGQEGKYKGKFLANFKRGPGNYKGLPGESTSNAATSPVGHYPPNDLGLYDMVGNVNEWVFDLYRPLSFQDFEDFNPVRRDDTLDPESTYGKEKNKSLIDNKSRVYKGGSWKDCAHWLKIGTRRYLDEDASTATIGFRCAMTSMGQASTQNASQP